MRRQFGGAVAQTTVNGSITSSQTSITVADGSTYPDGSVGPFSIVIDKGLAGEEKVLVTTRSVNTLNGCTRGYDGTAQSAHNNGATVNHCGTSIDFDEANSHVNSTTGVHGVTGAVVGTTDTQTLSGKTLTNPVISAIVNTGTLTLPTSTDTIVGRATTDTLTNKTLTAPTINGTVGGTASLTGTTLDATSTIGGVSGTTLAADHAAWTSYTPALTASVTNPTLGAGSVQSGRYMQIGKTVICQVRIQFGTSGTAAGNGVYLVSLPVAPITSWTNRLIGSGDLFHASGSQPVTVHVNGTAQTVYMGFNSTWPGGTSNSVTHINLWGWSTSDIIDLQFAYEAA